MIELTGAGGEYGYCVRGIEKGWRGEFELREFNEWQIRRGGVCRSSTTTATSQMLQHSFIIHMHPQCQPNQPNGQLDEKREKKNLR